MQFKWIRIPLLVFAMSLTPALAARGMILTSKSIKHGRTIPLEQVGNTMGCTGENKSPDLQWSGAPAGTKYFAVTMYDPAAPTGSGWWHWVVFNIPAGTTSLPVGAGNPGGALPEGTIQARNDAGEPGYDGPCPPAGSKPHNYMIRVFALKDKIPLDQKASPAMVGFYIHSLALAQGQIVGLYARR